MVTKSHNTTLVIDDFLENPDELRHYALTQPFKWTKKRWHPGTRTECLSEYNYPLYQSLCYKFLGAYFPELQYGRTFKWEANCFFHYAVDGDNEREVMTLQQRRVHYDDDAVCAGIIYLSPNPKPKSGTITYIDDETEDLYIANRYNRMLMFPSGQVLHGVDKTFGTCKEDGRLQILFFLHNISYDLTKS